MTSGSTIWITCKHETKKETIDGFKMFPGDFDFSNNLIQFPDTRNNYCVCSFMKNLYVIGGRHVYRSKRTRLEFTTRNSEWEYIRRLSESRSNAACTVFEGKIVVSGGYNWKGSKSVEAYDHHENKWTYLPYMIDERYCHGSVSMGNKLFVIGGNWNKTCEAFDSISRKFTAIKKIEITYTVMLSVVVIGNKIFAFPKHIQFSCLLKHFYIYDVLNDQWCVKDLSEVKYVIGCSKLPIV